MPTRVLLENPSAATFRIVALPDGTYGQTKAESRRLAKRVLKPLGGRTKKTMTLIEYGDWTQEAEVAEKVPRPQAVEALQELAAVGFHGEVQVFGDYQHREAEEQWARGVMKEPPIEGVAEAARAMGRYAAGTGRKPTKKQAGIMAKQKRRGVAKRILRRAMRGT